MVGTVNDLTNGRITLPRGIRNNNPGNIDHRDPWQGLVPASQRKDARFAEFVSPEYGIRALARVLISYQDKYGINTIAGIINRWAPPTENNTTAYVNQVTKAVGELIGVSSFNPDSQVDIHKYHYAKPIVEAIIRHENGRGPLTTANTWFDDITIDKALALAGIEKPENEKKSAAASTTVKAGAVSGIATAGSIATDGISDILSNASSSLQGMVPYLDVAKYIFLAVTLVTIGLAIYSRIKEQKRML